MIKIQTIPEQKEFAQFLQLNKAEIHLEIKFVNQEDFKLFQEYQMYFTKIKQMFGDVTLSRTTNEVTLSKSTNEVLDQSQSPLRHEFQQSNVSNTAKLNSQNDSKIDNKSTLVEPNQIQDSFKDMENQSEAQYIEQNSYKEYDSIFRDEPNQNQNNQQTHQQKMILQEIDENYQTPKESQKYQFHEFYEFDHEIKYQIVYEFYKTELDQLLMEDNIKLIRKNSKYQLFYNSIDLKQNLINFFKSITINQILLDEISVVALEMSEKYQKDLRQKKINTFKQNDKFYFISKESNKDISQYVKKYEKYRGIVFYFNTLSPIEDEVDQINYELMVDRENYFKNWSRSLLNLSYIEQFEYAKTHKSSAVLVHMNFIKAEQLSVQDFDNSQQFMLELLQECFKNLIYYSFQLESESRYSNQFQQLHEFLQRKENIQNINIRYFNSQIQKISLLGEKREMIELFDNLKNQKFLTELSVSVIVSINNNSLQEVSKQLSKIGCNALIINNWFLQINQKFNLFIYLKELAENYHQGNDDRIQQLVIKLNKCNFNEKGLPLHSFSFSQISLNKTNDSSFQGFSDLMKIQQQTSSILQDPYQSKLQNNSKLAEDSLPNNKNQQNEYDNKIILQYENPTAEIIFDLEKYETVLGTDSNQLLQIISQFTTNKLVVRTPFVSQLYRNYFHSLGITKQVKVYFVTRNNRKYTSFPSNMVFFKNETAAKNKFFSEKFYVLVEMLVYPKAKYRELKENPNQWCFKEPNQVCPHIALYQI